MIHLPALISDLGYILVAATVVTVICKYLKQPVVLGYLIAGLFVGQHIPFVPSVQDTDSIKVWAEIGVIFLLFGLGLEFSFKKLAKIGKSASITATVEVLFMLSLGFLTGQLLGWSKLDSLFLGGIVSISSTTIIVRAFDELGVKTKQFAQSVFGVLIVEDLAAILLMVILTSLAVSESLSGFDLILSGLRLAFFLILWFTVGIYILPNILRRIRHYLNDETTLIISIGLCLTMVMLATQAGFSPALGAFVMGSLLAETKERKRIEHLIEPVKNLFAAVFFISVGMLLDPQVIIDNWSAILIISLLVIFGKLVAVTIGALLSGQPLQKSVQIGMSLTQIGEFSFIIATLGVTLQVTSSFLYPIAVAVSVITTFTTPYMIRYSEPFHRFLEKKIPPSLLGRLERYRTTVKPNQLHGLLRTLWEAYGIKIVLNTVIVLGIGFGIRTLLYTWLQDKFGYSAAITAIVAVLSIVLSTPFIWAIVFGGTKQNKILNPKTFEQLKRIHIPIGLVRILIGILLIGFLIAQYSTLIIASSFVLLPLLITTVFASRFTEPLYHYLESKFIHNLNENDLANKSVHSTLAPWDASLAEFIVSADSSLVGQSLQASSLKEKYGITIALIQRGSKKILAPSRDDIFFPYDQVFIVGSESQIEASRLAFDSQIITNNTELNHDSDYGLENIILSEDSVFTNKPIRTCGIREATKGLIVGVERNNQRLLSPDSSLVLQSHDIIWVVGDRHLIKSTRTL